MQEYVTDAIVLTKQPSGELDSRYSLFTKKFGKMTGRTKSSRKVTSKLAGHLEPGNAVKARFIEKSGTQIVDALKMARTGIVLGDLAVLNDLLPEMDPDAPLWEYLARLPAVASSPFAAEAASAEQGAMAREPFSWTSVLRLLGWDPEGAACAACGGADAGGRMPDVRYFYIPRQEFFCEACVMKSRKNDLSLIKL
jgi:recombinational DNA repair protein (RecF pathway)